MLLPNVTIDLRCLLAAQLAVRTLESGLVTALVSEVAVAITLQGETVQALGTIVKSLLCSAGRLLDHFNAGTYGAHEGIHHEKIWKVKINLWDLIPDRFISGRLLTSDKFIVYLQIYQQATDNLFHFEKVRKKEKERNIHRGRERERDSRSAIDKKVSPRTLVNWSWRILAR